MSNASSIADVISASAMRAIALGEESKREPTHLPTLTQEVSPRQSDTLVS